MHKEDMERDANEELGRDTVSDVHYPGQAHDMGVHNLQAGQSGHALHGRAALVRAVALDIDPTTGAPHGCGNVDGAGKARSRL